MNESGSEQSRPVVLPGYTSENITLTSTYSVVILVGVFCNLVIIIIVWRKRSMQTTTNILLVNNACADLLTLLWCIPFLCLKFFPRPTGLLADIVCILITKQNITSVTLAVSVLTLCLLAVERYNALLKPMKDHLRLSKGTVGYALLGVWSVSIMLGLPLFFKTYYNSSKGKCRFHFQTRVFWIASGSSLLFVLSVICFCYLRIVKGLYFSKTICAAQPTIDKCREIREKRKVIKLLLMISVAFVLCLMPRVLYCFFSSLLNNKKDIGVFKRISFLFLICNSALNPVICISQNSNYINSLRVLYHSITDVGPWKKTRNTTRRRIFPYLRKSGKDTSAVWRTW